MSLQKLQVEFYLNNVKLNYNSYENLKGITKLDYDILIALKDTYGNLASVLNG